MATEVSPRGWHEDTMQIDPAATQVGRGLKRPTIAGYAIDLAIRGTLSASLVPAMVLPRRQ